MAISGLSNDMREIREGAAAGNERAALAVEMFVARAAEVIASAFTWTKAGRSSSPVGSGRTTL